MRKAGLIIVLILAICGIAAAEDRSAQQCRNICEDFLRIKNQEKNIATELDLMFENNPVAKVYNLDDDGFVVTPLSENLFPVIAYSWQGSYDPAGDDLQFRFLREELKLRKEYYETSVEAAELNNRKWTEMTSNSRPGRPFQQWPAPNSTSTGGWCETVWTQSGVYNDLCPNDHSGNRSVVGCVATAMAQIMHFHKFAGNPTFNNSDDYSSGYYYSIHIDNDHEELDFPNWAELNDYMADVSNHFENGNPLTDTDLAALNFACGVSVEMNYSSEGSGAYTSDVASALRNKFDYDSATWIENYGSSFYTTIANNQKAMKPCEFSIYTSGWNNGHAIVCDGYNTDNYFHLNYGWGSSNIGWYYLPQGMPSNYTIVGGAVQNIEGGEVPVPVTGSVSGTSGLQDCYIRLEGEKYVYEAYSDEYGNFAIPAVKEDLYLVSAQLGRTWYVEEEIFIDESNNVLALQLYNFEALTGNVSAAVPVENTFIALYEDNVLVNSALANQNGNFSIPEVLPGNYTITASLQPDYFAVSEISVTPENQTATLTLQNYPDAFALNWAGAPQNVHTIVPITITCAIKITHSDLPDYQTALLTGVNFTSPINDTEGSLAAQLWRDDALIWEENITDFAYGEQIYSPFSLFYELEAGYDYYAGYSLTTENGNVAWYDAGPRLVGKGAYFRINSWMEMPLFYDFNFCITADFIATENTDTSEYNLLPANAKLQSCYPNPFHSEDSRNHINIEFALENPEHINISCYNLKGQKISEIYDQQTSRGIHQITWQPDDLASGIYLYILSNRNRVLDTKKTIIIK